MQLQTAPGAKQVIAQQASLCGMDHGLTDTANRQRVFHPHVKETFFSTDGSGGDHHAFDHAVRIAFHHAPVHEGTRVSFIRITDHVLRRAGFRQGEFPFAAGRKAAAATAPQSRLGDLLADLVRTHLAISSLSCCVAAGVNVLTQITGIEAATLLEHATILLSIKRNLTWPATQLLRGRVPIEQSLDRCSPT